MRAWSPNRKFQLISSFSSIVTDLLAAYVGLMEFARRAVEHSAARRAKNACKG